MGFMRRFSTAYLLTYNGIQLGGWIVVVAWLISGVWQSGGELAMAASGAYPLVQFLVNLQGLELVHVVLGLTKGSLGATFVQTLGRFVVSYCIYRTVPEVQALSIGYFIFISWALIELVRYPFYGLSLLGICPGWLSFLRYHAFIPLYPTGMVSEWVAYRVALPYLKQRDIYSVHMPNWLNFEFSFYYLCCGVLSAYFVIGPMQFKHVLQQRNRRYSPQARQSSNKEE